MTWSVLGDTTPTIPAPDPGPVFKDGRTTRIMPLGDSITRGQGGETQGGYRGPLATSLKADGHDIAYVGWMRDVSPAGYWAVGGWRIRDSEGTGVRNTTGLNGVDCARIYKPDIILAHLGTNDLGTGVSTTHLDAYLSVYSRYLDAIYSHVPAAHVFIARIVLLENGWDGTKMYNNRLQQMVEEYIERGRPYHLVTGMEAMPAGSWEDGIHPNKTGYTYMAGVWHDALNAAHVAV